MSAEPLLPPLPEPHGYIGPSLVYCWHTPGEPLLPQARLRYTADQMHAYARSAQAAAQGMTAPDFQRYSLDKKAPGLFKNALGGWLKREEVLDWLRSQNLIKE